ncbi:MAG: mechanosensitive ion channel family protein [Archangium sp.]
MADGGIEAPDLLNEVTHADQAVEKATAGFVKRLSPEWRTTEWLGLERWQWVALPVLIFAVALVTWLLVRASRALSLWMLRRKPEWQRVVQRQEGPLTLWWASWLSRLAVRALELSPSITSSLDTVAEIGVVLGFFWAVTRGLEGWTERYLASQVALSRPGSRALVSLVSRTLQFVLAAFGILAALSLLGYQVGNVLAGLGIGGIALALGAQKTLENLFGAFALTVDQPIREGDFVKVDDAVSGTVERIGLRSTQLRTQDRTVVTIPNGKLADMRLENYAARDRIRLATTLTLLYSTTSTQLEAAILGCREVLKAEEKLWPDNFSVRFVALNNWSLDVEVIAWFTANDFDDFKAIRERVLLGFMRSVEKAGTGFAFPTQTLELKRS